MNTTIISIQRILRYLTIGCLATTAVIGAMAVLAGDIDLRTIATVLLIGIAAPIAIPMIQRLIDARPMIRVMAVSTLVMNILWLVGALFLIWGDMGHPGTDDLLRIVMSLFITTLAAVIVIPLPVTDRAAGKAVQLLAYVTICLVLFTYISGIALIWSHDSRGDAFRLTAASSILMIASIVITQVLAIAQRKK